MVLEHVAQFHAVTPWRDAQGRRYKSRKGACDESCSEPFDSEEVDRPSGALHLCKHVSRSRGGPRRWCNELRIEKTGFTMSSRASLRLFGEVDQVNAGTLAGIVRL